MTKEEKILEEYKKRFLEKRKLSDGSSSEYIGLKGTALDTDFQDFIKQSLERYRLEILEEERQFILNILDGIDEADIQMGNINGGTKAVRFALQNRIIK